MRRHHWFASIAISLILVTSVLGIQMNPLVAWAQLSPTLQKGDQKHKGIFRETKKAEKKKGKATTQELQPHPSQRIQPIASQLPTPIAKNRCLPNVVAAFDSLSPNGQPLGFWMNNKNEPGDQAPLTYDDFKEIEIKPTGVDDDALWKQSHMQGIQRLREGAYMVVSASSEAGIPGHVYVVHLKSRERALKTGTRFRSNQIEKITLLQLTRLSSGLI